MHFIWLDQKTNWDWVLISGWIEDRYLSPFPCLSCLSKCLLENSICKPRATFPTTPPQSRQKAWNILSQAMSSSWHWVSGVTLLDRLPGSERYDPGLCPQLQIPPQSHSDDKTLCRNALCPPLPGYTHLVPLGHLCVPLLRPKLLV